MNKRFILFLAIFIVVAGGAAVYYFGYRQQAPVPSVSAKYSAYYAIKKIKATNKTIESIGLTPDNFPFLDGATASQPIRSLIACEAFKATGKWYETESREMFIWTDFEDTNLSDKEREKITAKIEKNSKTHDAYLRLIRGDIDLILVSTMPSDDELKEAKKLGAKLELTPIGLDGFIFLVNPKNPVDNLSTPDIVDIYTGKIRSWKKFTGQDSLITPYTRKVNSGSQELMEKLVMKGTPIRASAKEEIIISMENLLVGVEQRRYSIGYSLYYYKNNMIDKRKIRPNVKLISVDGVEPNPKNIASKEYPYVFNIYAVTRSDEPKNSPAYQIKEWLTNREGQGVIKKAGYVSMEN